MNGNILLLGASSFCLLVLCTKGVSDEDVSELEDAPCPLGKEVERVKVTKAYAEQHCFIECSKSNTEKYDESNCICKDGFYRQPKNRLDPSLSYCAECKPCSSLPDNPYIGRACDCGHTHWCCPKKDMHIVMKNGLFQCQPRASCQKDLTTTTVTSTTPSDRTCAEMEHRLSSTLKLIRSEIAAMRNEISTMNNIISANEKKNSPLEEYKSDDALLTISIVLLILCLLMFAFILMSIDWSRFKRNVCEGCRGLWSRCRGLRSRDGYDLTQ